MSNYPFAENKPPALLPRKAMYLQSDIRLLGQHFQVPFQFPKDFFSVILEKGEESGTPIAPQVEDSKVGDCRATKEGLSDHIK